MPTISVRVLDASSREPVSYAKVRLVPRREAEPSRPEPLELRLVDEERAVYLGEASAGRYFLVIDAAGFAMERRAVTLGSAASASLVLLGRAGQEFYYRGPVRVPFDHDPDRLGVFFWAGADVAAVVERADAAGWVAELDAGFVETGWLVLRRAGSGADGGRVGDVLRALPGVGAVGPVVIKEGARAALLVRRVLVRFALGVAREQMLAIAGELGLTYERDVLYAPRTLVFRAPSDGEVLSPIRLCERLRADLRVEIAETLVAQTLIDHAVTPTDPLYPFQWGHALIGLPDAWQALRDLNGAGVNPGDPDDRTFGSASRVVGFLDTNGVPSDTLAQASALNPDLAGTVSDGSPKAAGFLDVATFASHNGQAGLGGHGARCAGVGVARAGHDASSGYGVAGAAGNARFLGVRVVQNIVNGKVLVDELLLSDAIAWAAGLETGNPSFPPLPTSPAEILSLSFGTGSPVASDALNQALEAVTIYGRGGRGVIVLASAGNEGAVISPGTPISAHPNVNTVAASSLASATEERATAYTNTGEFVSVCAPSSNPTTATTAPARTFGVMSVDIAADARAPATFDASTTIVRVNVSGTLQLASTAGIAVGQAILVGDTASGDVEGRLVSAVVGDTITPNSLLTRASATEAVLAGPATCTPTFGGTSAAAPLVSGVAALMLSARPTLTWVEVRDLLRSTAVKIDPTSAGWTAANFHPSYGFGRVNAAAAVTGARDATNGADLVVRENLSDVGDVPSPGWHPLSPDVWVENGDVAAPVGLLYAQPPNHQNPIRGQANTIFVRVKNRGGLSSSSARARVLLAHFPGVEFIYPQDWTPADPADPADPLALGTYLLDEVEVPPLAAGASTILKLSWPVALLPPEEITVNAVTVRWHPCLLVEVTPQDGPIDTSGAIAVRRSNNLAQRNVDVVDGSGSGAASGVVAGSRMAPVRSLELTRAGLPQGAEVHLTTPDPVWRDRWLALAGAPSRPQPPGCLPALIRPDGVLGALLRALGILQRQALPGPGDLEVSTLNGQPALLWRGGNTLSLPLDLAPGARLLVAISLEIPPGGGGGALQVRQRLANGELSGGYTMQGR